jgi:hypothetical protein
MTHAGAHERARRAWRTALEEDDRRGWRAREQRLLLRNAVAPRRASRVGAALQLALGVALGGLVVAAWLGRAHEANAPVAASTAASLVTASPPAPATGAPGTLTPATPSVPAPTTSARVVATRSCTGCRKNGATVAAGEALDGAAIDVPAGAILLAAWSVSDGLVDPRSGVDVVGPARVHADDFAVVLEQGSAIAETRGRGELRAGSGARLVITVGADATRQIDVTPARTRIDVARGEVSVRAAGEAPRVLRTGEHVEIVAPASPSTASVAPAAPETTATPSAPLPLAPAAPPPNPRPLLDAALAQLAAGNAAPAVATLNELVHSTHDAVAFEAATTLARLAATDRERASAWTRYLQRERPTPSAEIAMASLANALLDMGNTVEASVWVTALASRPPVPEAAALTERARGRLSMRSAEECLDHDVRKLSPARKR